MKNRLKQKLTAALAFAVLLAAFAAGTAAVPKEQAAREPAALVLCGLLSAAALALAGRELLR